jgi:hypothetical protein
MIRVAQIYIQVENIWINERIYCFRQEVDEEDEGNDADDDSLSDWNLR